MIFFKAKRPACKMNLVLEAGLLLHETLFLHLKSKASFDQEICSENEHLPGPNLQTHTAHIGASFPVLGWTIETWYFTMGIRFSGETLSDRNHQIIKSQVQSASS